MGFFQLPVYDCDMDDWQCDRASPWKSDQMCVCSHVVKHPTLKPDQAQWQSHFRNHTAESVSKRKNIVKWCCYRIVVNSMIFMTSIFLGITYTQPTSKKDRTVSYGHFRIGFYQFRRIFEMYISIVVDFFAAVPVSSHSVRIHYISTRTVFFLPLM